MVGPEFASCWLKIRRAEEHLNALKSEIKTWLDRKPYSIRNKHDPDTGRHSMILEVEGTAPFDRVSLIAGDCAHNLRCSLDHLTYALAVVNTGKTMPQSAKKIQFPIVNNPTEFDGQRYRLVDLSKQSQKFIESVQPYHKKHTELPSILQVLSVFDDIDKHRLIHVTYSANVGGKITFMKPSGWVQPTIHWLHEPLEHGKEFLHFTTSPHQPKLDYNCEVSFTIGVSHIPGPKGRATSPLEGVAIAMVEEVKRIVNGAI
jgi:hypothetical protein